MDGQDTIYTIGHSNHPIEAFIALLKQHKIARVVDVRSQPYSQWAHQFNRELLAHDLLEAGIDYAHMGDRLGGRPKDLSFYTPGQGRPNYKKMAQDAAYRQGIADLLTESRQRRIAVMCSEGDYQECHRHLLITQTLLEADMRVLHIRPDGTCVEGTLEPEQLSLFG